MANFFEQFHDQPADAAPAGDVSPSNYFSRFHSDPPADRGTAGAPSTVLTVRPSQPDRGVVDATARGAAQGLTANFGDEIRGLVEASGANPEDPASVYKLISGALKYWGGDTKAKESYDTAVARERELNKTAEEQHPVASTVGNIAGAVALPLGAGAGAATLPGRMAAGAGVGGVLGGLAGAGEGEGAADSVVKGASGAALGGILGGAAPAVITGIGKGISAAAEPIINQFRGAVSPDAEAGRRVITALRRDAKVDPNATNRLTPAEFAAEPTARIADTGGELTRRLADSASITSPEGGNALKAGINDRFEGQGSRVTGWLNKTFNFPNAVDKQEAIDRVASTVNKANYARAYQDGARPIWDDTLKSITASPDVQTAIRDSTRVGANDAVIKGFKPPVNPFQFAADGTMTMKPGVHPTLQFWDQVKRSLGGKIGVAKRGGDDQAASQLTQLKQALVNHLDSQVGSYKAARQGAAQAFGAENALEAGQNFVTSKMGNDEARRALAKMSPIERQLFQDGFVSEFVASLREVSDRRSILNKITDAPAARERLEMVLGKTKSDELQAKLRVEGIMDRLRTAVTGNSWTAQRLYSLGLAGGAGLSAHGGYDMNPKEVAYGAILAAVASGGKKIDARVAQKVAEMLISRDPSLLAKGLKVVSGNSRWMDVLRSADDKIARIAGDQAPVAPALQLAGVGRADDKPKVPRPPGQ